MNPISVIEEKLKKYPELSYKLTENSISVTPENGFEVWLNKSAEIFTVGYEGWHEEFSNPEEALNCFAFGLSEACRLKIISRNGKPHSWTVQELINGSWVDSETTGLLLFPFWVKPKINYLQNSIVKI